MSYLIEILILQTVNWSEIEQVCVQKFLGIKLDEQLNFNGHIDDLCKKFLLILQQRIDV